MGYRCQEVPPQLPGKCVDLATSRSGLLVRGAFFARQSVTDGPAIKFTSNVRAHATGYFRALLTTW